MRQLEVLAVATGDIDLPVVRAPAERTIKFVVGQDRAASLDFELTLGRGVALGFFIVAELDGHAGILAFTV